VERYLIWETARPYLYLRTTDDRALVGGEDDLSQSGPTGSPGQQENRLLAARFANVPAIELEVAYR
jgi:hypothetical protein